MLNPSVVITNHKRVDFLESCMASVQAAGVQNVVIVSTGANPKTRQLHRRAKKMFRNFTSIIHGNDPGNNQAWLEGVAAVKTDWAVILHDDDILTPEFEQVFSLNPTEADFFLWDARMIGHGQITGGHAHVTAPHLKEGIHPSWRLTYPLFYNAYLTFSPVSGMFRRDFLVHALSRFEERYGQDEALRHSPTMIVGNDLYLWLLAIRDLSRFRYIKSQLNGFGCHYGSISYQDHLQRQQGQGKLLAMYNRVREGFLAESSPS